MQQANGFSLVANVAGICNSEHTLRYGEGLGRGGGGGGWEENKPTLFNLLSMAGGQCNKPTASVLWLTWQGFATVNTHYITGRGWGRGVDTKGGGCGREGVQYRF